MKTKPYNRHETFLAALSDSSITAPTPSSREELYLAKIAGKSVTIPAAPYNRYETYLAKLAGEDVTVPMPASRLETFLYKACGYDVQEPIPANREEIFWKRYIGSEESGAVITIQDASTEPVKVLTLSIVAMQEGTGTPSRTNVRNITGYDDAIVTLKDADGVTQKTYTTDISGADTVYGGSLNVLTGDLTVTHRCELLSSSVSTSKLDDGLNSYWATSGSKRFVYASTENSSQDKSIRAEIKKPANNNTKADIKSNMFVARTSNDTYNNGTEGISVAYDTGAIQMALGTPRMSLSDLQTLLEEKKNNGQQLSLMYKLTTPEQYNVAYSEIVLLSGYNNITCNCGTITLKYTPDL